MNRTIRVEKVAYFTDHRGMVVEPLGPDEFASQRNSHLVITSPRCLRGNHYHRAGTEVALVLGPALVRYKDGEHVIDREIAQGESYRFTFPPGVPHAMLNSSDHPMVILSFNTEPHDPDHPDVVREVLIETDHPGLTKLL